jgi:hypothetical protein
MITMQMSDEYGTYFREAQTGTTQLNLRTFTAVDQEQLAPNLHYLR